MEVGVVWRGSAPSKPPPYQHRSVKMGMTTYSVCSIIPSGGLVVKWYTNSVLWKTFPVDRMSMEEVMSSRKAGQPLIGGSMEIRSGAGALADPISSHTYARFDKELPYAL